MDAFNIQPAAKNPLSPHAILLEDVEEGTDIVTLNTYNGSLTRASLATGWRVETIRLAYRKDLPPELKGPKFDLDKAMAALPRIAGYYDSPLPSFVRLLANDTYGKAIDLCDRGLHHPIGLEGTWEPKSFSVLVSRDTIPPFHLWLEEQSFKRAASKIEDMFFEYFIKSDDCWNNLLRS